MTQVSATTTVGVNTEATPSAVTRAVEVRPAGHPLDIDVAALPVPRVGACVRKPGSNLPRVVVGPDGEEIEWVSRALRMLASEGLSPATCEAYAKHMLRAMRVMWAAGFQPHLLTGVQYTVVRRWLTHCVRIVTKPQPGMATGHLSPMTVDNTETAVDRLYTVAVRAGLVDSNPVDFYRGYGADPLHDMQFDTDYRRPSTRLPLAKVQERVVVTLHPDDRVRLRNAKRPRDRALWTLCLDPGPRISEALSITREFYHPQDNLAQVVGKGLGGERRFIPLSDETVETIDAYLAHLAALGVRLARTDPIFRSVKAPYEPFTYNGAWLALRRALKNSNVHPHALRHTAATELLNLMQGDQGRRLIQIQYTLGHKNIQTTRRYLHQTVTEVVTAHLNARNNPLPPANPTLAAAYGPDEIALLAEIRQETTE